MMRVPQWYEDKSSPVYWTTRAFLARVYWGLWPVSFILILMLVAIGIGAVVSGVIVLATILHLVS